MSAFPDTGTSTTTSARRRRSLPPVLLAMPIAAALLGVLLALAFAPEQKSAPSRPAPAPTGRTVATGDLRLTLPRGWIPTKTGPAVPGFPAGAETLHARARGADVAIALLPLQRASLLPPALDDVAPRPRITNAGAIGAYRYAFKRRTHRTVLAVPTTQGIATIACAAAARRECDRVLRGLRLAQGSFVAPDADAAFLVRLSAATKTLDTQHLRTRERLAHTTSPEAGAHAAARLAAAYETSARTLRPLVPARHGESATTIALLDRLRDGYQRLAGAVRGGDRAAFKATGRAIDADEARLAASLQAWQRRLTGPAPG
jgi:hypothetical protein